MAMIDYGSLVFKNGKQINFEQFMNIRDIGVENEFAIDKSGWSKYGEKELMDGNYFAFAGNNEFYIVAYKNIIKLVYNGVIEKYFQYPVHYNDEVCQYYEQEIVINSKIIKVKSYNYGKVLDVEFSDNGTTWRLITGYGIDVNRKVFDKIWRIYGITEDLYTLIHILWERSDKMRLKERRV